MGPSFVLGGVLLGAFKDAVYLFLLFLGGLGWGRGKAVAVVRVPLLGIPLLLALHVVVPVFLGLLGRVFVLLHLTLVLLLLDCASIFSFFFSLRIFIILGNRGIFMRNFNELECLSRLGI